jgi:hypothetical protein
MKMLDVPQSGSYQDHTSSRNRFGQYKRSRATPVNPNSTYQSQARSRLSSNAANWRAITSTQRAGWTSLGSMITRNDPLGQTYTLTGFQAYLMVNNNNLNAGNAIVAEAPAIVTPEGILTLVVTLTAAVFSLAYTTTPLAAGARLFVFASPQRSAGRNFEADLRLIHVSLAAAASPANIFSAYVARFGTPVLGNKIFLSCVTYKGGFTSMPLQTSAIVSA